MGGEGGWRGFPGFFLGGGVGLMVIERGGNNSSQEMQSDISG